MREHALEIIAWRRVAHYILAVLDCARKRLLGRSPLETRTESLPKEGTIRTLSVSLLAVATVAAGILISRVRLPRSLTDAVKLPRPEHPPVSLDALREAGL